MKSDKFMTVKDIVQEYLDKNGYEGLTNQAGECACLKDELAPCCADGIMDCEAGHKVPCNPETCAVGGGCEWHIQVGLPSKEK